MPTPTPKKKKQAKKPLPGSKRWIYDEIMKTIEPDLTSERLPYLNKEYADETLEECRARMERYDRAFQTFDVVVEDLGQMMVFDAKAKRHEAQATVKAAEQREQEKEMQRVEKLIDDSSHSA